MSDFVHLHVHTEYSLLDGACRIAPLMNRLKELGQSAVAITDHGVMYGVIEFYKQAKKNGIKPIIGCELYVAKRTIYDKQNKLDNSPHHLVLLCKDNEGYQNLIKLVSIGFMDGFYGKPRVDLNILKKYSKGIIALTACLSGNIPRRLIQGDYAGAKEVLETYIEIFGRDNIYIELQNHGIQEQKDILPFLIKLSKTTGVPTVATNDVHYLTKEDSKTQSILVGIQTNRTINDQLLEFETDEFYVKSRKEMEEALPNVLEAMNNTVKIAQRCNVEFEFGNIKLPQFIQDSGLSNIELFRKSCYEGLVKNYGENFCDDVKQRLEYELSIIEKMGYVDYFLIVNDFISYAKTLKIPVGPGRGSGAGSIAAYCMGITGIDPIKYGLLFERFLNPERVSMPDFDIDFCYVRRQEVIDYVTRRYGNQHVAQIITFGTMAARAAIRDVGRAMGMSYQNVDVVAKQIPANVLGMTIEKALSNSSEFRELYNTQTEVKNLVDTAIKLEGMPRHASTHAAGVVITKEPVFNYVPVQKNNEAIVTQFTMGTLEQLGLLKMDFLGLRNLTVIDNTQNYIRETHPDFDIINIPLDDKKVYSLFTSGETEGVFQFESTGIRNALMKLSPNSIEDIIAMTSLYRPGPMESIPTYIRNRHNPEKITYKHHLLKPILEVTYGCIVYQEQVMQICRELAGFSYGHADLVRRAMSKKKADVMHQERKNFVSGSEKCRGAVENGIPENTANAIFDEMETFASYAFNKSHAAAYALIAYQTAYLKCHHTKQYMASLLTSVLDFTPKLVSYIGECERLKIPVLPPDINESYEEFFVTNNGIRFGLLAIKGVGKNLVRDILSERGKRDFINFYDFIKRMSDYDLNKKALEGLILAGAFDGFNTNRKQLITGFGQLLYDIQRNKRENIGGQLNLFGNVVNDNKEFAFSTIEDYECTQRLKLEKEVLGIYVSRHPLSGYSKKLKNIGCTTIGEIMAEQEEGKEQEKSIKIGCIVSGKQTKTTRKGQIMSYMDIEDATGTIEMLVFPSILEEFGEVLNSGEVVLVSGRASYREDQQVKIICEKAVRLQSIIDENQTQTRPLPKKQGIYLKTKSISDIDNIKTIIVKFKGTTPVYVYCEDIKKLAIAPKELWVTPNINLINQLKDFLGDAMVVLVLP